SLSYKEGGVTGPLRSLVGLAALAILVLVGAGCGDTVSLDPVAQAADTTAHQTSEHMSLTATVTTGTQVITMVGDGDFRNDGNLGTLTARSTSGAMTGSVVQT